MTSPTAAQPPPPAFISVHGRPGPTVSLKVPILSWKLDVTHNKISITLRFTWYGRNWKERFYSLAKAARCLRSKTSLRAAARTLKLRPFQKSDLDDFKYWVMDEEIIRSFGWILKDEVEYLRYLNADCIGHHWRSVICLGNTAIGKISVT